MNTRRVTSADGTTITLETEGSGPPLVLVGGAFNDRRARTAGTPLAALLAPRFTVTSYDRRGRGESGDTPPYAIAREVEDLAAVIAEAGGAAFVYGLSSGAILALEAATRGLPITRLALYEPPIRVDTEHGPPFDDLIARLVEAAVAGRRGEAVEIFMTRVMQMPAPVVDRARTTPMWPALEALAHTLAYDVRIAADAPSTIARAASVRVPTLAMHGGACPPWMREGVRALAEAMPAGRHLTLEGQTHDVDLKVLAGALDEFFTEANAAP